MEINQITDEFNQFLKESGRYFGNRGRLLVQVLCDSKEPLSAKEMLYLVKRLDPMLSFGTVYCFLTLLAASGLVETIPREWRGPVRFKKLSTPVPTSRGRYQLSELQRKQITTAFLLVLAVLAL